MIYFLATEAHCYTFQDLPKSIKSRSRVVSYEEIQKLKNQQAGPIIFTDLDRLSSKQLLQVTQVYDQLKDQNPEIPLLNNPAKVLLRYDLLKRLYKEGINDFNIFRESEDLSEMHFPVFVRSEHVHTYNSGLGLAFNTAQLVRNISNHTGAGADLHRLIITECCDVSDEYGIFNKYAAYFINGQVIPRHLYYSKNWYVSAKSVREVPEINIDRFDLHEKYIQSNPHKEWIQNVFEIAGTDYGRIDYGLKNGVPQVWEINLNPNFSTNVVKDPEPDSLDGRRARIFSDFNEKFELELIKLDHPSEQSEKLLKWNF
ncbi:MAG: hypothetical protein RIM99_06360 [Cyclobacteriaceae bacterium]